MQSIWRPKLQLTEEQRQDKFRKDGEYEIAHLNLTADFKAGRITQTDFDTQHAKQWNDYLEWSKANGLYEEVTPEQQLKEAESGLDMQLKIVNEIRLAIGKPEIETKEKVK